MEEWCPELPVGDFWHNLTTVSATNGRAVGSIATLTCVNGFSLSRSGVVHSSTTATLTCGTNSTFLGMWIDTLSGVNVPHPVHDSALFQCTPTSNFCPDLVTRSLTEFAPDRVYTTATALDPINPLARTSATSGLSRKHARVC